MFEVLLERHAEKDLDRLPGQMHCRKLAGAKHDWRIRVGDYRVIYEIADAVKVVRVYRVRHRRDVYR